MDKLEHYRQIIQGILAEHSQLKPAYGEIWRGALMRIRAPG